MFIWTISDLVGLAIAVFVILFLANIWFQDWRMKRRHPRS